MDNGDGQGYVQSWIADQARRTQRGSPENDSHAARVTDHARPWRPLNLPFTTQTINIGRTCSPRKRDPEIWDRPILGLPSLSETSNGLSPDKCVDKTFNTTHEASINDGRTLGSPALKEGHFSKRLRRKTHDDRYDRDRHKRRKHSHNREATQQKGEHIDEVSRSAKRKARPGETVVKNFKSPYIHVDNITVSAPLQYLSSPRTYSMASLLTGTRCPSSPKASLTTRSSRGENVVITADLMFIIRLMCLI
jgi:hypothetical protein